MTEYHQERIEALKSAAISVEPQDTMAEAGRKVLLTNFIAMLKQEAGSRTGENIEDVHDMRVAIRRMRSIMRLLEPYFKGKALRPFQTFLRKVARELGAVRDLDVMIQDLTTFEATLDDAGKATLQEVIDSLNAEREVARSDLNRFLDKKAYRRFVDEFAIFLTNPGWGVKSLDGNEAAPHQVRHVLPVLINERLAVVRAYDTVIENADRETMHALRVEFKRLRYTVALFEDILGSGVNDFIGDLKAIQDHLGRMNDIVVGSERLETLMDDLDETHAAVIQPYLEQLRAEYEKLTEDFLPVWRRFNTKAVQRKLAVAIAGL